MKLVFCCINLFISATFFAQGIDLSIRSIPSDMLLNANTVVRKSDFKLTVKSPSSAIYNVTCIITILSEKSPYSQITIGYNKYRKVSEIKANIYDKEGALIREIKKKEIKDYSAVSDFSIYEDNRILLVDLHNSEYPYTIEYEYEVEMSAIFGYPDWRPQYYNNSVQKSSYTLITPPDMDVNIKECNGVSPAENSEVSKGNKAMTWYVENLPAVEQEPYSPDVDQLFPLVMISPVSFEIEGNKGSMKSWESYSAFLYEINKGTDALSPEMKEKVAEMTAGLTIDEKIDTLYKYLQKTMRYVSVQLGIGGWQSFDAEYVEQNKYGDCKALSTFMKAMLNEAGIESHCAIIQNGTNKSIIPEDLAQSFFNHQILFVPLKDLWLDCTSTTYPSGYIGSTNSDRPALLIKEKGGSLIMTPKYNREYNTQSATQTISVAGDGSAEIEYALEAHGPSQEVLRYFANNDDKLQQSKWIVNHFSNGPSIEIVNHAITIESRSPTSRLNLEALSSRFGSKSGKRLFTPVFIFNKFENPLPSNTARKLPLAISQSYTYLDTINLAIPIGYGVESAPKPETIILSDFGSYQLNSVVDDSTIHLVRKLIVDLDHVEADQYQKVYDFFKQIEKIENTKVVLIKRDS